MFLGILFLVFAFVNLGVYYFKGHMFTAFAANMLLIKAVGLVGYSIGIFTDNDLVFNVSLIIFVTSMARFWGSYILTTVSANKNT